MANPKAISPLCGDGVDVADTGLGFGQAAKPVRRLASAVFLGIAGYITVVRDVEGDAALSHRRILHALHDMRRFLGGTDHGHDDTVRTDVRRERYGGRRSTAGEP